VALKVSELHHHPLAPGKPRQRRVDDVPNLDVDGGLLWQEPRHRELAPTARFPLAGPLEAFPDRPSALIPSFVPG
jgi:hypothetical protein